MHIPLFRLVHLRDGRAFIIHAGSPAFIAEVVPNDDGTTDIKVRHLLGPKSDESPKHLAGLMSRMGDWYKYQIDNDPPKP